MYRIISIKLLLALGLFLGGPQFCFASNNVSSDDEICIKDDEGQYWRPCVTSESADLFEAERQKHLPFKKRRSMRDDFYRYDKEADILWQRIYPVPVNQLGKAE